MQLLEDVLATIHDAPAEDIRVGFKYTGVRIDERIGVAYTFAGHWPSPSQTGKLIGTNIAALARSWNLIEAAMGVAAINAQLDPISYTQIEAFQHILTRVKDHEFSTIGVVGSFPFIKDLRQTGVKLYVFEQRDIEGCLPPAAAEHLLPKCDLAIISGTTFINKTLQRLLEISTGYTLVIGPSTPLSPVLFDYGADALAGIKATDGHILEVISQGGGTRAFKPYAQKVFMEKNKP